jgi:hypothetical protein
MIVANSIAINKSTASVRDVIRKSISNSKMALFGTRPAKLFNDAEIRVLIFLGKKDMPDEKNTIFTSEGIKFTQDQRDSIFNKISFEDTRGLTLGKYKIGDNKEDSSLPKVGNYIIRNILLKLKEKSTITIQDKINTRGFKSSLEFRKTGGYWLNALEKMPYNSTKIEKIKFKHELERDLCILIINSSLFYLYWSTYGNLRDFPLSLLNKFPFPSLDQINLYKTRIEQLTRKFSKCLLGSFKAETGRVGEFRTGLCRPIIDEVDDLLSKLYELDQAQNEYIKTYDCHIRKHTFFDVS